jgi:glycosyltransferase involved in cell wall biosynthesis
LNSTSENNMTTPPDEYVLTIVIPALNEEDAIARTITNCIESKPHIIAQTPCRDVEIILVSDGSTDGTVAIGTSFVPRISVEVFEKNRGYGAALKHGFAVGSGNLVSFLDGDSTCDAMNFIPMVNKLIDENADVCIGSRMGPDSQMPGIRRFGNMIFRTILNVLAGSRVSDTASGMRVIRRDSLQKLYPLPDGLHFTPAMSCRAIFDPHLKIEEIDMSYAERVGASKLSVVKDGLRFLRIIMETALTYQPIRFFGTAGVIFLLLALGYGISPVLHYLQYTEVPEDRIYRLIAVVTFGVAGLMLTGVGFLANRLVAQIHGYYEPKNRRSLASRFAWVGVVLVLLGMGVNSKPLYQYLTMGEILEHWSYLALGALFVLSGIQIFCYSILELMLDELWSVHTFRERFKEEKK